MNDEQIKELLTALNKIAEELAELNRNASYLASYGNMTVKDVRSVKEPRAKYYD